MITVVLAIVCCAAAWLILALADVVTGRDHDGLALVLAVVGVALMGISFGAQS